MGIWKFLNLPSRQEIEEQKEMLTRLTTFLEEQLDIQSKQIQTLIEGQLNQIEDIQSINKDLGKAESLREIIRQEHNINLRQLSDDLAHIQEGTRLLLVQDIIKDSDNLLKQMKK